MRVEVTDPFGAAADPDMPLVARALDPGEINRRFEKIRLHDADEPEHPRLRKIRVVRHKPGRRCLIEYAFSENGSDSKEAPVALMGKLRARGPDDAAYRLSEALATSGFDSNCEDGISIPAPLGIVPELNMWFQQKVPGRVATDLLAGSDGVAIAKRIAEAAHKIHTADIRPQRRHGMADELRILHDRLNLLGGMEPAWEARLSRLLDACDRLGATVPEPDARPIHRDFYADQVIVDGDRLYLLDFDLCCLGDPALDIGNFTAHLKEYALRTMGDPEALAAQEAALVERFVELTGSGTRASIDAYATLTLARHIYISTLFEDRRAFTTRILELCEQRLGIAPPVPRAGNAIDGEPFPADPTFPHLATAMDPEAMRAWFQRKLKPVTSTPLYIRDCRLDVLRHRPGERCNLQYSLTLEETAAGKQQEQIVTGLFCSEERARHIGRKLAKASSSHEVFSVRSAIEPVTYIPELGMLVQAFPADYRLPGLRPLMAEIPSELTPLLLRCFGDGDWEVRQCAIDPVRYRSGRRAVLRYALSARDKRTGLKGVRNFYIKTDRDTKGEELAELYQSLWTASLAADSNFNIDPPLTYLPEFGAVVFEETAGMPVDLIARRDEGFADAARQTAQTLSAFQGSDVVPPRNHTAVEERNTLALAQTTLQWGCPELTIEVGAILTASAAAIGDNAPALIHGDFKARHVFLDGERTTIIDLDEVAAGDPLLDAAAFLADLAVLEIRDGLGSMQCRQAAQAFTKEYVQSSPRTSLDRLSAFYAGAILKRAANIVRRQQSGWQINVERLVGEAQRAVRDYHR